MKRIILGLFVSLWAVVACAQVPMTGGGLAKPATGGGGGYVGLGDLSLSVTILTYNGVRCYKNTSTGNIADITDTATGNTTGTRLKCDGAGNVVAVVGSTCGTSAGGVGFITGGLCSTLATTCATSCNVLALYDQSGINSCSAAPCDLHQTALALRPLFLPSTQNAYGAMRAVSGAGTVLVSAGNFSTVAQPVSVSTVGGKRTDITGGSLLFGAFPNVIIGYLNSANTGEVYAGSSPTFTMSDAAYHSLQSIVNGSSSQACVDSSACNTGLASGANTFTGAPLQMFQWFGSYAFDEFEAASFSGAFSAGDITALTNNQHGTSGYNF